MFVGLLKIFNVYKCQEEEIRILILILHLF